LWHKLLLLSARHGCCGNADGSTRTNTAGGMMGSAPAADAAADTAGCLAVAASACCNTVQLLSSLSASSYHACRDGCAALMVLAAVAGGPPVWLPSVARKTCNQLIDFFAMPHRWHKDIVVDIVGYRRNGHNELDDPRVTLPLSYQLIEQHPTVLEIYARKLQVRRVHHDQRFTRHAQHLVMRTGHRSSKLEH
jgi:hypothetical protein